MDDDELTREQILASARMMAAALIPSFADVDPRVVGAVLGLLVATYLAGHRPGQYRDDVRMAFDSMVLEIISKIDADSTSPWKKETRQ